MSKKDNVIDISGIAPPKLLAALYKKAGKVRGTSDPHVNARMNVRIAKRDIARRHYPRYEVWRGRHLYVDLGSRWLDPTQYDHCSRQPARKIVARLRRPWWLRWY